MMVLQQRKEVWGTFSLLVSCNHSYLTALWNRNQVAWGGGGEPQQIGKENTSLSGKWALLARPSFPPPSCAAGLFSVGWKHTFLRQQERVASVSPQFLRKCCRGHKAHMVCIQELAGLTLWSVCDRPQNRAGVDDCVCDRPRDGAGVDDCVCETDHGTGREWMIVCVTNHGTGREWMISGTGWGCCCFSLSPLVPATKKVQDMLLSCWHPKVFFIFLTSMCTPRLPWLWTSLYFRGPSQFLPGPCRGTSNAMWHS
jgi:hypothetical protein